MCLFDSLMPLRSDEFDASLRITALAAGLCEQWRQGEAAAGGKAAAEVAWGLISACMQGLMLLHSSCSILPHGIRSGIL